MRTVIVYQLDGQLYYEELTDRPLTPQVGTSQVFRGSVYKVTEVLSSLGVVGVNGQPRTGLDKLMELLAVSNEPLAIRDLLTGMANIGSGDGSESTPGGIVLPVKQQTYQFDEVILVLTETKQEKPVDFGKILRQVSSLVSKPGRGGSSKSAKSGGSPGALPKLRVGENALGVTSQQPRRRRVRKA